jgi:hypothetical protein
MCNKFLILGFGCEHEEVLGFQGRMFTHDGNGNKEKK